MFQFVYLLKLTRFSARAIVHSRLQISPSRAPLFQVPLGIHSKFNKHQGYLPIVPLNYEVFKDANGQNTWNQPITL